VGEPRQDWEQRFSQLIDRIASDPKAYLQPYGPGHPIHQAPLGKSLQFNNTKYRFFHGERQSAGSLDERMRPNAGLVCYLGDEPYSTSAVADQFMANREITAEHVALRRTSIAQAVAVYMPPRTHLEFLNDYLIHVPEKQGTASMEWAFKHSARQRKMLTDHNMGALTPEALVGKQRQDARREILRHGGDVRPALLSDPALNLAFIVYRAANIDYLDQMLQAVERSALPPAQKDIACDVLMHSFDQFRVNLADALFIPLTIMEYKAKANLTSMVGIEVKPDVMKQAIGDAFERGYAMNIFETDMVRDHSSTACPARARVALTAKSKLPIEGLDMAGGIAGIYDYITQHRAEFKPLLDQLEQDILSRKSSQAAAAR